MSLAAAATATDAGLVLWLDPRCNLLGFPLPSGPHSSSPSQPQPLPLALNYSASGDAGGSYVPCTQLTLSPASDTVFYLERYTHKLYALAIQKKSKKGATKLLGGSDEGEGDEGDEGWEAVPLPWSPFQLPQGDAYQPLVHHSLLAAQGSLWAPLRYVFGAYLVDTGAGKVSRLVLNGTESIPAVLAGNAGLPPFTPGNEDGAAAVFAVYSEGTAPPLIALNSSASIVWSAVNSTFRALARDDPVVVPLADAASASPHASAYCVVVLQQAVSGGDVSPASLFAVNATTGAACGSWPHEGLPLPDPYSREAFVVGTPAAISGANAGPSAGVDGDEDAESAPASLYYVVGNHLLHLLADDKGYRVNATAALGVSGTGPSSSPPIALLHGWGQGRHVVAVGTEDGRLLAFDARDVARGPTYAYELPAPPGFKGRPRVVGPFMAATGNGSVVLVAEDSGAGAEEDTAAAALYAVWPAILPPARSIPPPPGPPAPGRGSAAAVGILVLVVAGALIVALGVRRYIQRRRAREALDRSWYTSMAAFEQEQARLVGRAAEV